MSKENFILVEFTGNNTSFDVKVDNDTQILMAIAGLESYVSAQSGLDVREIRELVDESKVGVTVKKKEFGVKDGK